MIRQTIAAAVLVALAGSGCSFRPVYGVNAGHPDAISLAFNLAEPTTRLEQIVYEELSLRFSLADGPNTPDLKVTVVPAHRDRALSRTPATIRPNLNGAAEVHEVTVTIEAVVTLGARELFRATRFATAFYDLTSATVLLDPANPTRGTASYSSVLGQLSVQQAAEEQATRAATESLRLALLAKFPKNADD